MIQTFNTSYGEKLYKCNPEKNTECSKRYCAHNIGARERLCDATTRKEYALKIGETAEVKEYTPPRSKKIAF